MLPAWRAGDLPRPEESHICCVSWPFTQEDEWTDFLCVLVRDLSLIVAGGVGTRVSWHFLLLSFFFFLYSNQ